jgi:hypothetical protein
MRFTGSWWQKSLAEGPQEQQSPVIHLNGVLTKIRADHQSNRDQTRPEARD